MKRIRGWGENEHMVGALLIGVAVAYAILRTLHDHHKKGRKKAAEQGFSKSIGVLGLLLVLVGVATVATSAEPFTASPSQSTHGRYLVVTTCCSLQLDSVQID